MKLKFDFGDRVRTKEGSLEGTIVGTSSGNSNEYIVIYIVLLDVPKESILISSGKLDGLSKYQAVTIPEPFIELVPNSIRLITDFAKET